MAILLQRNEQQTCLFVGLRQKHLRYRGALPRSSKRDSQRAEPLVKCEILILQIAKSNGSDNSCSNSSNNNISNSNSYSNVICNNDDYDNNSTTNSYADPDE